MKRWLKYGLIGGIAYVIFHYVFGFISFFGCYSAREGNFICNLLFRTIFTYIIFAPYEFSRMVVNSFGIQSSAHPLYSSYALISTSIRIFIALLIGFIIGIIIWLILNRLKKKKK